ADGTAELAARSARVVASPPGRARQMNAGAAAAGGDVILFLHCDTRLPEGALALVREALADPGVVGGGFCHRFDRDDAFSRFISLSANIRSRGWRLFFGDQAIFIRREAFEKLGGYPDLPLFEDWELSRKMRAAGRLALIETPIVTSTRRIDAWGKWRSLSIWWGLSILYVLGVPAARLARRYENVR
ncbi:MAG: TIGR04283 family arsenosugar biosynthesis glycosyltransferase, partial [bacterium]|nr:TIGR04283 family arsenosugar biosynthesis glycosyltransferase [bacterium]